MSGRVTETERPTRASAGQRAAGNAAATRLASRLAPARLAPARLALRARRWFPERWVRGGRLAGVGAILGQACFYFLGALAQLLDQRGLLHNQRTLPFTLLDGAFRRTAWGVPFRHRISLHRQLSLCQGLRIATSHAASRMPAWMTISSYGVDRVPSVSRSR